MSTIIDYIESQSEESSPLAKHVSSHLQDPVGATKGSFGKLSKAKLEYDMAREETQRNLAPVQSVIQHVSQLHNLQTNMPTPGMDSDDPNKQGQQFDERGNPLPPVQGEPGQDGGVVGGMNKQRPSLVGHQPGVAPMSEKQVVPPKLGMASPGNPTARNSPAPNAQDAQFNPAAKTPKGNRSLPGAKGPGDAKVENRTKKAQSNSIGQKNSVGGRQIKIQVHANKSYPQTTTIEASRSLGDLKFKASIKVRANANVGENDLRNSLQEALKDKLGIPASNPCASGPYPWIQEIYPFENYFVYNVNGKTYRQNYELSGSDVTLTGDPKKVRITYIAARGSVPLAPGGALGPSSVLPGSNPATGDRVKAKRVKAQMRPVGGPIARTSGFGGGGGGGGIRPGGGLPGGGSMHPSKLSAKRVKALEELSDKEPGDTQHQVAFNPKFQAKGKTIDTCMKCGGLHAEGACPKMQVSGHSRGAKKGWSVRNKGHVSGAEKTSHYQTLDKENE